MIEKGRHFKMEKSARKCPFCSVFEDEIHFLLDCKTFVALRRNLLTDIKSELNLGNLIGMNDKEILKLLIGNLDIAPTVAKYLTRTMELTDFLMSIDRVHNMSFFLYIILSKVIYFWLQTTYRILLFVN